MNMMIVSVDEGTEFDLMPPTLQQAMLAADIQWCESRMVNTVPFGGKVLVLILSGVPADELQDQIDSFGLDWLIVAVEGVEVDADTILPFMADEPVYNEEADEIEFVPVTSITGKLQTWAGRAWAY